MQARNAEEHSSKFSLRAKPAKAALVALLQLRCGTADSITDWIFKFCYDRIKIRLRLIGFKRLARTRS